MDLSLPWCLCVVDVDRFCATTPWRAFFRMEDLVSAKADHVLFYQNVQP